MNMKKHLALACMALALFTAGTSMAANVTWDANGATALQTDGAGAWLTANQWWTGAANATWTSGDDAIFGNGGAGGAVTLGVGGTTVNSLTMNTFSGAYNTYTLGTAGNTITLNNGITVNANAGPVTIISPITLGGAQSWLNNNSFLLTVGTANIVNGGFLLTVGGIGNATISGVIGNGAGGLTKNGTGTLTLTAANTYTGPTTLNAGTIVVSGAAGTIKATTGATTFNGGALTLSYADNDTENAYDRVADAVAITVNGGTLTYTTTTAASTRIFAEAIGTVGLTTGQFNIFETLNKSAGSQTLTLSGLTQAGQSTVTFSSPALNATINMIKVTGASGAGASQNLPGGLVIGPWASAGTTAAAQTDYAVYDASGYVLPANITASAETTWTTPANAYNLSGATTLTGTRTITGLRYSGAAGALGLGASTYDLETYGLLNGGSGLLTVSTTGSGGLTTPSGGGNLYLTTGNNGITVTAPIKDNGGNVTVVKSGTGGTLTLSGSNGYTGGTVLNAGTLAANSTASLPGYNSAGKVVFNGGTLQLPSAWAMADINTLVANATKNSGALALDTANGSQTQTAAWNLGALGLAKVGANTLTLNQANTYTGRTTVNAGTLQLSHANALGSSELYLAGSATVLLDTTVNLTTLWFASGVSTVSGGTLNFAPGGTITAMDNSVNQTIQSAITGSPAVRVNVLSGNYQGLIFAPNIGTQTLGVLYLPSILGGGSDKAGVHLAGTTTGNSVASLINPRDVWNYAALYKDDSGTWTVGNVNPWSIYINGGTLVANGTLHAANGYNGYNGTYVYSGAALHYNNAGAVNGGFTMNGGSFLDNSSGAAITTSTYNPGQAWSGNWTFIGSQGASSDLNLGTGAVTLNATYQVTVQNAATTLTVGGAIGDGAGVFDLTKAGAGTLKLSGANTYDGSTAVTAGTLMLANNSALAVSALNTTGAGVVTFSVTAPIIGGLNGSVDLATKFTTGYPSVTTLTLNPGAGITASYSGAIANGAMNLTKTGAGTQILSGNNTYGGTTTVSAGTLVAGTPGSLPNYGTASKVFLSGTGTLQTPVGGSGWTTAQVDTLLANLTMTGGTLGLDIASGTETLSGAAGGANGLTKIGAGTLGLNQANTYSGATTINGGTLLLNGASGAIASSSGITLGMPSGTTGTLTLDSATDNHINRVGSVGVTLNNGTLNFIGNATTASTETIGAITAAVGHNQLVLSGGDPAQVAILTSTAGAVTRTAGATLNILADGTSQQFKFTGGTAGINKGVFYGATAAIANEFAYYPGGGAAVVAPTYDGSGNFATPATTLTASKHNKLSGDDASEGAISIYSLNMPSNYSLTDLTGNLTFTNAIDQGAIIKSGGGAAQIGTAGNAFDIVGQTGGELVINTVDATDNLTLNVGISNGAATPAVVTSALTKTGAGTLTLTANRDYLYTGATYVNAGTLVLNSLTSAAGGGFRSSVTINNGGKAKLGASDKIIDTAVFTVNAGGTFDLAGSSERIGALSGSGSVTNTGGAATLTLQASSTFSGVISGNTALTLVNIGPFVLSGQNTYSGATTVTGDGGGGPTIIKLGVNNALPSGGILNFGTFGWHLNLDLAGYDQTVGPLTTGGQNGSVATVYNSVGASKLTLSGGATAVTTPSSYHVGPTFIAVTTLDLNNAAQTFIVADIGNVNDLTISSVIQNGALTKTGAGLMLLTGANTYAGATTISGGTLEIGGAGVLGSGAYAANITNNATFSYNSTASQTLSGVISGTGALVKNNTGTLNLTGANTYSGATTVSAGTLLVNGSLNVTSRVTVASGATLAGAGTMGIVTNNGTLAVGNGATMGTLTTSNLVMNAGSSYVFDLNGTGSGDSVTVNGALTLNGSSVITIVPQGVFNGGYTYTLFNYKTVSGTLPTTVLGGNPKRPMTLIDDTANKRIILKVEGPPGTVITFR